MGGKQRLDWVDAAKGLSIILVVMMYSAYNIGEHTGKVGVLHYAIGFATPFRMPEFFLISGLFLSQVIARDWRRYGDRRILHYFYFYALWVTIDIVLKAGIAERDLGKAFSQLALAIVEPYGVLWFIYMLGVFSAAAKLAWQFKAPHWLVLSTAALLQMAAINSPSYIVTQFAAYFFFFYLGFAAAPLVFRVVGWAERHAFPAIAALALWALAETFLVFWPDGAPGPMAMRMGYAAFPPLHLALAVAGALALCVLGMLLMKLPFMDWLRWLGENSLVVYLAFTIPMSVVRILATRSGLITDAGLLGIVVLVASTAAPVALYLAVMRTGIGTFLFKRPAWAHLSGTPGSRGYVAAPQPAE